MKKHFLTRISVLGVALLGLTAGSAAAQNRPNRDRSPEQFIERRIERLDQQLDLTDAQQTQIRGILEKQAQDMKEHLADSKTDRDANRAYMHSQIEQTDQAISAVLTPEQQQEYAKLKADRKARFDHARNEAQNGRNDRNGRSVRNGQMRGQLQRFAQELNLTDQQKDQLKQLVSEQREQMQTWRKDHPDASREERRAFMQDNLKQLDARIESVLTPDQVQKYHTLRDQMVQNWQRHGRNGMDHESHGQKQGAPAENQQ